VIDKQKTDSLSESNIENISFTQSTTILGTFI